MLGNNTNFVKTYFVVSFNTDVGERYVFDEAEDSDLKTPIFGLAKALKDASMFNEDAAKRFGIESLRQGVQDVIHEGSKRVYHIEQRFRCTPV